VMCTVTAVTKSEAQADYRRCWCGNKSIQGHCITLSFAVTKVFIVRHHSSARHSSFSSTKHVCKILSWSPYGGTEYGRGIIIILWCSTNMWEMIQDRAVVTRNNNRESCALCRTITFPVTLSNLWRSFQYCCYFVCAAGARSVSDS